MNKNQGFTLIELLAVVVILAIIMFLSLPVITYNVKNATKSSFENHARMILKNLPYQIAKDANFDLNTVNQTNISSFLKVDTSNYKSIQIEKINEEPYIIIVGANKWNNLVVRGTYNNMIVDEGLILWYDSNIQNELMKKGYPQNSWEDLSGNGNNGSLINFNYNTSSGWVDGLTLDGTDDYFQTKQNVYVDFPLSYEVYFKFHKLDRWNSIISTYEYGENSQNRKGFKLSYLDGNLIISFGDMTTNNNVIIKNNLELEKE